MSCTCPIRGGLACHCCSCHHSFTGVEAFDRHQTIENGTVICRDPATFTMNGKPLFSTHRVTPDGKPMWSRYRPDLPQRTFPVLA
jgi:hypothetical protein